MNKLKKIFMYFIIIALFMATVSVANPVKVNAVDGNDPYHVNAIKPIHM